jgi:hypothetical protein
MVPLLAVNHELELGELFCNGQDFLIVHLLATTEASICLLLLLVERILAEVRAAHARNGIIHIDLALISCWPDGAVVVGRCNVRGGAARV